MAERGFWSKARVSRTGCWEWRSALRSGGYGRFRQEPAHRVAWESAYHLAIPQGLVVAHACDNPACIKPGHLFVTTTAGNAYDAIAKGRRGARNGRVRTAQGRRVDALAFVAGVTHRAGRRVLTVVAIAASLARVTSNERARAESDSDRFASALPEPKWRPRRRDIATEYLRARAAYPNYPYTYRQFRRLFA